MTGFAILLVVFLAAVVGYLVAKSSQPDLPPPPTDPEAEMRAAVELHRIRRDLETRWTKTEQRQEAERVRRQIANALDEADKRP